MKSTLKLLSIFTLLSFFTFSCSKGDEITPTKITGTWELQTSEGTAKKFGEMKTTQLTSDEVSELLFLASKSFTFAEDGKFTMTDTNGDSYGGNYTISGKTLSLSFENTSTAKINITYSTNISGSTLLLTSSLDSLIGFLDSLKETFTTQTDRDAVNYIKTLLRGTFTEVTIEEKYQKK